MITKNTFNGMIAVAMAFAIASGAIFPASVKADGNEWGYTDVGYVGDSGWGYTDSGYVGGGDSNYGWGYTDSGYTGGGYSDTPSYYDWGYTDSGYVGTGGGYYEPYSNDYYEPYVSDYYAPYYSDYYEPYYSDYGYNDYYDYGYDDYSYDYYSYDYSYDYHYTPPTPSPTCTIYASDYNITNGESTTLTWSSSNATSASLSEIGGVSLSGSRSVSLTSSKTYVLTVRNAVDAGATCSTTITVTNTPPPPHNNAPVCALSASDNRIEEGDSTTLHWTSENATSATLSSIGSVATGGSRSVSPTSTKTYTLTVSGSGGTATCSDTVIVEEEDDNNDLWCELDASDTRVEEGDRVTLEWDTRGAERATINQGIGSVDEDGGTERVTIDDDTTFRLTVRDNDGDEETCSVTVRVDEEDSDVVFLGNPTNNPLTSVYLSDLPYTGLDFGTASMIAYWFIILAGGGALAYFTLFRAPLVLSTVGQGVGEDIEEQGSEDVVPATPVETDAFVAALTENNNDAALEHLRTAAVDGTGVEELIAAARAQVSDAALAARLDEALEASRLTGIRGAKDILFA